jgi:hypothetical protein
MSDAQFMARVFAFMLSMLLLCAGATSLIRAGLEPPSRLGAIARHPISQGEQ